MSFWSNLFSRKKETENQKISNYNEVSDFVNDNIVDVKRLLSSTGYNDRHRRLSDMAQMCGCHVMLLCRKIANQEKFIVIEASDHNFAFDDKTFTWQHSQPAGSSDATQMLATLPFSKIGATGFISVPIKNQKNIQTGILLGLSLNPIENIDSKIRLLHLLAPTFDAEIEVIKLRQDKQQYEQRISSLRQNIEVMTTDLKIEKEKSAENKELKSIFLTNLSHEIRTPMNVIMGFTDLLDTVEDEQQRHEFITVIKQNCEILLKVIDNLIDISKLQSSYMFKASAPVQLNDLLDTIRKKTIQKLFSMGKKDISVETSYAMESPNDTIWNSEEIITKTIEQLLDNSCKFTEKGKITFGYTFDHKDVTFFVRDTGCGIKSGEENNIFNMFSIADNSLVRQSTGTGIGLAVAKKYVELANGKVWCDTGYKGGACFYFTIPTEKL